MLDMGFVHDVKRITSLLPSERQTAMFTATLGPTVERVAAWFAADPLRIQIAPEHRTVKRIAQSVCHVSYDDKLPHLQYLVSAQNGVNRRTIVFSRTRRGADKLQKRLNALGLHSEAIHGDKSQSGRQRALDRFWSGLAPILVATDIAARGIDVKDVELIVNYDLPDSVDTYIHRIGRTARSKASGRAVTFCDTSSFGEWRQIERGIGSPVTLDNAHPYHDAGVLSRSHPPKATLGQKSAGQAGDNSSFVEAEKAAG